MNYVRVKIFRGFALVVALALISPGTNASKTTDPLTELWTLDGIFTQPESAAFDPVSKYIFVSNVNGYAKDGNGFVSRISFDGKQVKLKWLEGLNSPTGLTVTRGLLYVVDYDELLKVDIKTTSILQRYITPHAKPGLNDVVVTSNGDVFVTGSASSAIYKVVGDQLITWKQDPTLLKHANGLFEDNGKLLFGGTRWLMFDIQSGEQIESDNPHLVEIDGISSDGCGGYIVSMIDDNRLWRIEPHGHTAPLSPELLGGIDLSFNKGKLFVPRVGNSLTVYQLGSTFCE